MKTLIKNGTVVTASDTAKTDVLIDGERVAAIGNGLDQWHQKAQGKAHIDYGFHMIVREVNDNILEEMDELVKEGVPSFKLFMAYPGVFMLDDASIFRAMSRTAEHGGVIMMDAENGGAPEVVGEGPPAGGEGGPTNN